MSPVACGIIDLGRALNLEIIAEGVEEQAEALALLRAGCHFGQGYYFGRPLEAPELSKQSAERRAATS